MIEKYKELYKDASNKEEAMLRLYNIMLVLRKECPWDKVQTHDSLKRDFIEETYEAADAINRSDMDNLREELGDVLLHVIFQSIIAEEDEAFCLTDVINDECNKMIRRHPHIFSTENIKSIDKLVEKWENIKSREHQEECFTDRLKNVPKALPALMRSEKVQRRASRIGFDWDDAEGAFQKLEEEIRELREACDRKCQKDIEEELGDVLFSTVNISRFLNVDPEKSLNESTEKFIKRFEHMEVAAARENRKLDGMSIDDLNELWADAKNNLKNEL